MQFELDFNSDKSIYIQIEENIIKSIAKGDLKIGDSLPSVRNMAENIGVNLHTANKAYNSLKDKGYLNIDRRKGAIVSDLPLKKNSDSEKNLYSELEIFICNAFLSGISKEEFIDFSKKIYNECEVIKND
ncbi:GntR family transcriptional regulator [Peptacetobacter sp.]|uniref:GntR family transcriptional regulator n=1 Tax=Peptacetobacter sp. TaxID=2991975 RepID=UPI00261804DA|nr:GntR family transcriptional regulator [Peptacetobacter sp.]